jgi:hypothetical protein
MTQTTCHVSISLDGFVAGPDQDREHPLGVGGMDVHRRHLGDMTDPADLAARAATRAWYRSRFCTRPTPRTSATASSGYERRR